MVFLFFILVIIVILLLFYFSTIKIQIANIQFCSQSKRHLNENYSIVLKLCFLGLIPLLKYKITKAKLEKMQIKQKIKNLDLARLEKMPSFDKEIIRALKKLNVTIRKIDLYLDIGTENASLTSIIVPAISTIIAIVLRKKVKKFEPENQKFTIHPIYQNQNLVNLYFSGIFQIKMRHIISVMYHFVIKEKGVKKYERASDRRSYDYSYE